MTTDSSAFEGKLDNLYFTLVENSSDGVPGLLNSFFSFLGRRTDFFTNEDAASDPAKVENTVLQVLREQRRLAIERQRNNEKPSVKTPSSAPPPKVKDNRKCYVEEVFSSEDEDEKPPSSENKTSVTINNSTASGNGGKNDSYEWTQTLGSVEVIVYCKGLVKSKDVSVKITSTRLKVVIKNETVLDGELEERVLADECLWTLDNGKNVIVNLEKYNRMQWWSCVLKGGPKIDTSKIVPENSNLSDLDPETRQTVEKMLYDQNRKARGLPTSDQMQQAEMFEKFQKAHPELDFSKANINFGN